LSEFKTFDDFEKKFNFSPEDIASLIKKGEEAGVKYNDAEFAISRKEMLKGMKGLVASNLWKTNEYYRIVNEDDVVIEKALQVISDRTEYNKILGF
jgi:carboxyl-terminal processing protease